MSGGMDAMGPRPVPADVHGTARQVHAVFRALVPVMLLGAADPAIVAPALGAMAVAFDARDGVVWVMVAYLLCATGSTPLAGRLGDLHGRRSVVLGALALFLVGTLVCGSAGTLGTLLVGRCLQGLGGGALIALPNAIVADILSPRERGRYQAYIACTHAAGGLAGPLVGALLSAHASWRWIFWLQAPLVVVAAVLSWRTPGSLSPSARRGGLDLPGVALMFGATACLLLALSWAGRRIGWTQFPTLALFGACAALATAFLAWQNRAREPLLPRAVRCHPVVLVTSLGGLLVAMVHGALYIHVPPYLHAVHGMGTASAGSALAVPLVGVVLGAYLSGQYMRRSGRYKPAPLAGLALAALSSAALAWGPGHATTMAALTALLLLGLGIGASQPPMTLAAQNAVAASEIGIATAVHMFSRAVGAAVGVAASSALVPQWPGPDARWVDGLAAGAHAATAHGGAAQASSMLFTAFAATLGLAWLALTRLPVLPFREHAAHLERLGGDADARGSPRGPAGPGPGRPPPGD